MAKFERGSALVIQVEFKKLTPFGASAFFDPTPAPKISIAEQGGTTKIDSVDMTRNTTGKWYYILQTGTAWNKGTYVVTATSGDGTNTDVAIDDQAFVLT